METSIEKYYPNSIYFSKISILGIIPFNVIISYVGKKYENINYFKLFDKISIFDIMPLDVIKKYMKEYNKAIDITEDINHVKLFDELCIPNVIPLEVIIPYVKEYRDNIHITEDINYFKLFNVKIEKYPNIYYLFKRIITKYDKQSRDYKECKKFIKDILDGLITDIYSLLDKFNTKMFMENILMSIIITHHINTEKLKLKLIKKEIQKEIITRKRDICLLAKDIHQIANIEHNDILLRGFPYNEFNQYIIDSCEKQKANIDTESIKEKYRKVFTNIDYSFLDYP